MFIGVEILPFYVEPHRGTCRRYPCFKFFPYGFGGSEWTSNVINLTIYQRTTLDYSIGDKVWVLKQAGFKIAIAKAGGELGFPITTGRLNLLYPDMRLLCCLYIVVSSFYYF
jgi:hypothetical protein